MCFLDLADAFGSVEHDLIWYMLKRAGLDRQGIDLFRNIYTDCYTQYKCGSNLCSNIKYIKGVKQGCPISMTLFCISINILLSIMNQTSTSLELCDKKVKYAFTNNFVTKASRHYANSHIVELEDKFLSKCYCYKIMMPDKIERHIRGHKTSAQGIETERNASLLSMPVNIKDADTQYPA